MNLTARLALLAAGLLVAGAAQANCKPIPRMELAMLDE